MPNRQDFPFQGLDDGIASLIAHWEANRRMAQLAAVQTSAAIQASHIVNVPGTDELSLTGLTPVATASIPYELAPSKPEVELDGELVLQAQILVTGDKTDQGQIIRAVTTPWVEIIKQYQQDPEILLR